MSPKRLGVIFSSRRRHRFGAVLAVLACLMVVAVVVSGASAPSKRPNSSQGNPSGTATVQRHDLVETDTESGTISYANPQTVYNRLSGTITWLPNVGQVIKPGRTLFRVDGQPVTLMDGSAPAYRDLKASDAPGADIDELNRNLVRLGFDPDGIVVDDDWQPATTAGVELFQESLGEDETASLSLGQVVFLPGNQVIGALDGTVGSTGGGGSGSASGSGSSSNASTSPAAGDPEFVSLQRTTSQHDTATASKSSSASRSCQPTAGGSTRSPATTTTTETTTTSSTTTPCTTSTTPSAASKPGSASASQTSGSDGELSKLTALLKAEAEQLKAATAELKAAKTSSSSSSSSANRSSSSKSSGTGSSSGGPANAILQTTATQLIVTVDLDASSQSEAKIGAPVTVQLPSGKTVDGTITAVSPVAQSSSGSNSGSGSSGGGGQGANQGSGAGGSSSTIPVTIKLKGHHRGAGLNQASVSVNFAQAEAKHVLSAPVTALIATAGGGYAVQEANAPYQRLPVTTGLFAAGDVQISGPGIHPGLRVTNSQG